MSYDVGFTGTRHGLTPDQVSSLRRLLSGLISIHGSVRFHHGDCVGGDLHAHALARELGLYVITHPPIDDKLRAFTVGDEEREPKPYLVRNRDIVDETRLLIACPRMPEEYESRSGTWATIRYARLTRRPHAVIDRRGLVEHADYGPILKLVC